MRRYTSIIAIDTGGGDGSNWLPEFWNFQTGSIIKAFSSIWWWLLSKYNAIFVMNVGLYDGTDPAGAVRDHTMRTGMLSTKIGPLNPGQSVTIGKGKQINKNWYVVVDEDCPLYTTHTLKTIVSTDTPWRNVVLKTNEFYFKVEPPTLRIDVVLGAIGAGIASLAAVYYAGTRFRWW